MFYILFTVAGFCLISIAHTCFTPNNTQGLCQSVLKCRSLASMLDQKPIKPEHAEYLAKSQSRCTGYEGVIPIVCCPLEEAVVSNVTGAVTKTVTMPVARAMPEPTTDLDGVFDITSFNTSLLPTLEECGIGTEDKIWGGKEAKLFQYPWMVLIHHKKPNGWGYYHCGGVLISSRYVLTAAHCVKVQFGWTIDSVRLGEHNLASDEDCEYFQDYRKCTPPVQDILVEEEIVHKNYQYNPPHINRHYDIALLRLATPAKFTDNIKPICLPIHEQNQSKIVPGTNMVAAGWGKTENRSDGSDVKMRVLLPIQNNTDCAALYKQKNVYIIDTQLCAGGKNQKDTCDGDSGGPLMDYESYDEGTNINWYVYGIVSYGTSECGIYNWPGVYTRVSSYIAWILSNLKP